MFKKWNRSNFYHLSCACSISAFLRGVTPIISSVWMLFSEWIYSNQSSQDRGCCISTNCETHWGKKKYYSVQHIKQKTTTTGFGISLLWVLLNQRLFTLVRNMNTAVQAEGGKGETQALHVYFKRHKSGSATPAVYVTAKKKRLFFLFGFVYVPPHGVTVKMTSGRCACRCKILKSSCDIISTAQAELIKSTLLQTSGTKDWLTFARLRWSDAHCSGLSKVHWCRCQHH